MEKKSYPKPKETRRARKRRRRNKERLILSAGLFFSFVVSIPFRPAP
jgi:hypothetical protein